LLKKGLDMNKTLVLFQWLVKKGNFIFLTEKGFFMRDRGRKRVLIYLEICQG